MVTFIIATILLAKFPPGVSTNRGAQCKFSGLFFRMGPTLRHLGSIGY